AYSIVNGSRLFRYSSPPSTHFPRNSVFATPRSKIQRVTALSQIRSVPGRGWINKSARCAISFLRRSDTISFCPFSLCDRFTRVAPDNHHQLCLLNIGDRTRIAAIPHGPE